MNSLTRTGNRVILYLDTKVFFILDEKHKILVGERMGKVKQFLVGVKNEMKKVRWPNKKELFTYSGATIVFITFFGLFFAATDFVLAFVKSLGA